MNDEPVIPRNKRSSKEVIVRIDAAAAADHRRIWTGGVTLVLAVRTGELGSSEGGPNADRPEPSIVTPTARLLSIGHTRALPTSDAGDIVIDAGHAVLIPGLVNAHTHLDLTHVGPQPHDPADGFMAWAARVSAGRCGEPDSIGASVRNGVALSLAGGSVAVGDIDGSASVGHPGAAARARAALPGVSFSEFFAFSTDPREAVAAAMDALPADERSNPAVIPGLSPHAPYSVSLDAFREAARATRATSVPICTHLAESPEEREFVLTGRGPMREFLESIGKWSERAGASLRQGRHPVGWFEPALAEAPGRWVLAHVNDCPDDALRTLKRYRASVVYCPRASEYFGAHEHFGPHRYRDMLDAGIPVALGTDSIVNLDTADRISVLDEMRLLRERDGVEGRTLLAMATTNSARALGLDDRGFAFSPGVSVAGVCAVGIPEHRHAEVSDGTVDPLEAALSVDTPVRLLVRPTCARRAAQT
jgi:cytosine/adenosine deaminase-related metal-dependent hydrolase